MIKFFRHIRRALLGEGKFSKYLLYAIGEIVLVVIGILIALQINNWNSDRIEKNSEIQILTELKTGLEIDLEFIQAEQQKVNSAIYKVIRLQDLMKDPEYSYKPGLDTLFGAVYGMRALRLNSAFYEDLKSSGLALIKDKNIRLEVVQLFENNYSNIQGLMASERSVNEVNRPYYLTNFYNLKFITSATPNNYRFVWTDSYYHNIVDYRLITLEGNQLNQYTRAIPAIKELIQAINSYIEKDKK